MNDKKFRAELDKFVANARRENLVKAMDIIQERIKSGKIVSINFTPNKEYGEPDDTIIVDYSVDLSDGGNISDLGLETIEDAITDIAEELQRRKGVTG
jgi:hypothetical protein